MVELAVKNGINRNTYYSRINYGWDKYRASTAPVDKKLGRPKGRAKYDGEYAVYRKGELVVMGRKNECAEFLGVSENYLVWLTTPSGIARRNNSKNPEMVTTAVRLDEEDEDDE